MVTKKEHDITKEPLEDIVGDLFVNRHEELELYWDWAASIPNRILNSNALIGRRRTAILINFAQHSRPVQCLAKLTGFFGLPK